VNKVLENLSLKDDLTEIGNRRKFFRDVQELKEDTSYVLIMFDFNHFKKVNDTRGHEYGDFVLKTFSKELNAAMIPCGGELYRIGGDEFAAIISNNSCIDMDYHYLELNKRLKELHPDISIAYGKETIDRALVKKEKIERIMSKIDFKMYAHKDFHKATE
jgi:diguanylate cyclase (GGDEF)-like protein